VATAATRDGVFTVTIDDHAAAYAMTQRLLSMGHRRIGFIRGDANQTASSKRFEGYADALQSAGLSADPALVAQGDFSYRSGLAAAERLLKSPSRPTAIFASNDDMAAGAMSMAHRLGLAAPADLSICGFDDTAIATTVWPELTTVRQPIAEMAEVAVELLVLAVRRRRAKEPVPPESRRLGFTLVERQSDGPAPHP